MIKILIRFGLATAFGAGLSVAMGGCSGAPVAPRVAEAIAVAECQLNVARELIPHAETAEAVVNAARVGDVQRAIALLLALGLTPEDVLAFGKRFDACVPSASAPEIPTSLTAS